jgi:glutamine amidotransferase-like uncharacterized protein
MKKNTIVLGLLLSLSLLLGGCGKSDSSQSADAGSSNSTYPDVAEADPVNPQVQDSQDQGVVIQPQVLLFNGIGISTSDWQSVEQILKGLGMTYQLVNSSALTNMTLTKLASFKLMIVPGGNSNTINNNLSKTTKVKVRQAVRDKGLAYLGICAGAFAAVGTDFWSNTTSYYGFAVALGNFLPHWYPSNTSAYAAITKVTFASGTSRMMTWWDGPSTPAWTDGVIARYNDGRPAISQTKAGAGFVIVSGPHPEAPASWQYDTGTDPDGLDKDIAISLIKAAFNRSMLPAF